MAQSKRHVYEEQAADQNICQRFGSEKSEEGQFQDLMNFLDTYVEETRYNTSNIFN